MDYYFLVVQMIGVIAFLVLMFSYYGKNTDRILLFHIFSSVLYVVHYFLLGRYESGAYSGVFICCFEMVMDYLYYKTNLDKKLFLIFTVGSVIYGVLCYSSFLNLFPILAGIVDRYSLTGDQKKAVVGGVVVYVLWCCYDFHVRSISGVVADFIIVLSNIYILGRESGLLKKKG